MHSDIAIEYGTGKIPTDYMERVEAELLELEDVEIKVWVATVYSDGTPPKYTIEFTEGVPMYKTRLILEKKLYDVGQKISGMKMTFYVTKRVEKKEGWSV